MKLNQLLESPKTRVLELQQKLLDDYDVQLPIKVRQMHNAWFCVVETGGVELWLSEEHNPCVVSPKIELNGGVPLYTPMFDEWQNSIDEIAHGLPAAIDQLQLIQQKFGALRLHDGPGGQFIFELKSLKEGSGWLDQHGIECGEANREITRYNIMVADTVMWHVCYLSGDALSDDIWTLDAAFA